MHISVCVSVHVCIGVVVCIYMHKCNSGTYKQNICDELMNLMPQTIAPGLPNSSLFADVLTFKIWKVRKQVWP